MARTSSFLPRRLGTWGNALTLRSSPEPRYYLWAALVGLGLGAICLISPWLALGAILGLVFGCFALSRPIILCYAIIAAVALTSGIARGALVPMLIPHEAVLLMATGITYPVIMLRKGQPIIPKPIMAGLAILVAGTVIVPLAGYYARGVELTTSDLFSLLAPIKYVLLFWLFLNLIRTESDESRLIHTLLLGASLIALIGLLQSFHVGFITDFLDRWYPSPHETDAQTYGRVTSLLRAWNALGTFLMINLIMIVAIQGLRFGRLGKWNVTAALGLCGACLLASGSYAGLLGLIMGIVIVKIFDRRGLRILILLAIGLAISAFLLQSQIAQRLTYQFGNSNGLTTPQTLAYRFKVWQEVFLPILGNNLLWGIRPTLADLTFQYAESQYVYLLFRSGLISLVAHVLWVLITATWLFRKIRRSEGLTKALAIAAFAVIVVLSVIGVTNEVFTLSGAAEYFWMILAMVVRSPEPEASTHPAVVPALEPAGGTA